MTIEEFLGTAQQFWRPVSASTLLPGLDVQVAATVAAVLIALLIGLVIRSRVRVSRLNQTPDRYSTCVQYSTGRAIWSLPR